VTGIRINPRALRTACARALEAGPLGRRWEDLDHAQQLAVMAQAVVLLRAYADARAIDFAVRKGRPAAAAGEGAPEAPSLLL
jgi:hypothetical protein